jgi:hypothetical protein
MKTMITIITIMILSVTVAWAKKPVAKQPVDTPLAFAPERKKAFADLAQTLRSIESPDQALRTGWTLRDKDCGPRVCGYTYQVNGRLSIFLAFPINPSDWDRRCDAQKSNLPIFS